MLQVHGVLIRTTGSEAPSQLRRGQRLFESSRIKENLKHIVKVHKVIGKRGMKMAASVAIECKNEMVRKGGIAPGQWILGKFPRGVGRLLEE